MECSFCGADGESTLLFDAVTKEGLVKICENCSMKEESPVIRRTDNLRLKEAEKNQTVYERLSRMAGLNPKEHRLNVGDPEKMWQSKIQNENLRKTARSSKNLNYPSLNQVQSDTKKDLVRNYNWAILNARRARRLTQEELAQAISEPEFSIRLAEKGILPDNYPSFIRKIERYLGITLFITASHDSKQLGFDKFTASSLTLSDVQEIKNENSETGSKSKGFFPYWRAKIGSFIKKREEKKQEEEKQSEEKENSEESEKEKGLSSNVTEKGPGKVMTRKLSKEEMDRIMYDER